MTITVSETPKSRVMQGGEEGSAVLRFIIDGTESDIEAANALVAATTYQHPRATDLYRNTYDVDPIPGTAKWFGTVRYSSIVWGGGETQRVQYSFDTTGGTQHVTQSQGTRDMYTASGVVARTIAAINVVKGDVLGVDIVVPVFKFTEKHFFTSDEVNDDYKIAVRNVTGKLNDQPFRGNDIAEVLFLGASGTQTGTDQWEILFNFAASPHMYDLTVGDIAVARKYGWDYLWIQYQDDADDGVGSSFTIVKKPQCVFLEQMYHLGNLDVLGIG